MCRCPSNYPEPGSSSARWTPSTYRAAGSAGWARRATAASIGYDRLILAAGSVNRLLPIPGIAENAHGFRSLSEALYLRDHITRQLELAAATHDQQERDERCTFVVVGAGYTGTEVAAQGQLFTARLAKQLPALARQRMRWMILDTAKRVLPELDQRLSDTADKVLRERQVEVRMGQSVERGHDELRPVDHRRGGANPFVDLVCRGSTGSVGRVGGLADRRVVGWWSTSI